MLIFLLLGWVHASCGIYEFKGIPRLISQDMQLIVNEKTLSESVLEASLSEQAKLAPYLDKMVQGELTISKMTGPRRGIASELIKLDVGVPTPLHHETHSYLRLKREHKCW